ncbi:MAG: spermidine/putrescine ABC transporter ATP-binding protein [SAR324 cluster bacterium]|uniref:Spermidine/putrescine import ATP-binding protein PotA n=1 Tax=SAR324 cluster bacterium TaxID=2024889 RepID=A0A2A4T499_9DELT|nr:MAG: spermidine/putrescine ABC transporter ATP-binding protein [SAR324 cluster bacterium]
MNYSSPDRSALVQFQNVTKTYDGEHIVIKGLDLEISKGEFLTLLGPSGSGKSTCLMMLAGFGTPTSGDILLNGKSIKNIPPYKRNFGMVFQNYALFPHMTIQENVAFPLLMRKMSKAKAMKKAEESLDMVQLQQFIKRKPAQLSGGQQQRVAVARALVFDPELVLMDEPLGALDKQLRETMQMEIKHIHENLGITIIYVTHDQSEALTMSDRVAVFSDGIIQQIDNPEVLYEAPINSFVASFIGENNHMNGVVIALEGKHCQVKLEDGTNIDAIPINVQSIGDPTTLSIRPERVLLNPEPNQCANAVKAKVLEQIYLGDHNRFRIRLGQNEEFMIKLPNNDAIARIREGDDITVGWQAEHCRALDRI